MTLADKIYKFRNAVWEYRGKLNIDTGEWIKPPKPKAKARVIKGLQRLGLNVEDGLTVIDAIKTKEQFNEWLIEIRKAKEQKQ